MEWIPAVQWSSVSNVSDFTYPNEYKLLLRRSRSVPASLSKLPVDSDRVIMFKIEIENHYVA
ncbi:MAG: hypothetical protein DMF73_15155 [Acidobacteria bacterium]|nr:MAG: hypothetical protein DMF73_15155 [Acidobacteriota bacterium]